MLSLEEARRVLRYDPETGEFFWRIKVGVRGVAGARAGYVMAKGYRMIQYDGKGYLESRLAWFMTTGSWPKNQIDHADTNRSNNRFSNLRDATQTENMRNRSAHKSNKFGKGVSQIGEKYVANIRADRVRVYLGIFSTAADAKVAYDSAAQRLHGEFFRP